MSRSTKNEKAETAAGFWHRAVVWFAVQGIFMRPRPDRQRVLLTSRRSGPSAMKKNTDCIHKRTRPRRPQTNGKVERFNRTLLHEWASGPPADPISSPATAYSSTDAVSIA